VPMRTAEGLDILLDSALEERLVQNISIVGWLVNTYDVPLVGESAQEWRSSCLYVKSSPVRLSRCWC
jgi:hypothetical protein